MIRLALGDNVYNSYKKMTDIGQIWDDHRAILASFIHDGLNTQLGFKPDCPNYTYKELLDKEVRLTFFYDPKYNPAYCFGFAARGEEEITPKNKKYLKAS